MEKPVTKENKMGTMPISRLILSMSLPIAASMLVQALYNIVDSIFVSQICEEALTGVTVAFPMQNLMIAVGAGTGVGISAMLSKSLGEKDYSKVNKTACNGLLLAMLNFIIFLVIGLTLSETFVASQEKDLAVIAYGTDYLTVCSIFSLGLFGQITFERLLQSTGKTIYSMFTQAAGAIINIILDPILIFGYFGFPAMGIKGAAMATVIGQFCAMILGLVFNIKLNKEIKLSFRDMKPSSPIIKRIYAVGLPSIVMMSISSVMTYSMNIILGSFSKTATAVFGVYFKLQSFFIMPLMGLNNGIVPIISYNYGARKRSRITKTIKLSMIYAVSFLIVCFTVCQIFPEQLFSIFETTDEMMKMGISALSTISFHFLIAGFSIIMLSTFQALGNGVYSLIVSSMRQLVALVPAAYLLSLTGEVNNVWWSFPIAEIMSVVCCVFFMRRTYKKIISKLPLTEEEPVTEQKG